MRQTWTRCCAVSSLHDHLLLIVRTSLSECVGTCLKKIIPVILIIMPQVTIVVKRNEKYREYYLWVIILVLRPLSLSLLYHGDLGSCVSS